MGRRVERVILLYVYTSGFALMLALISVLRWHKVMYEGDDPKTPPEAYRDFYIISLVMAVLWPLLAIFAVWATLEERRK